MKKTRVQLILLVMLTLILVPVSASNGNTTNSTIVPTVTETLLTTTITYPVNITTTVISANATSVPLTTNTSGLNLSSVTVNPTGPSGSSTGNLTVASSPLGASILIDGVLYGNTPENVTGIATGNHIIRLTMSGYYDYEGTIYVVPGQTMDAFGTLQPVSVSSGSVQQTSSTIVITTSPAAVVTVQPTVTTSESLSDNPTIIAALIGIVTASIGAFAALYPHFSKPKK